MSHIETVAPNVLPVFQKFSSEDRKALFDARALIFEVAKTDSRIGTVEETLRWGEPAYLTTESKTGSTIRLGIEKATGRPAVFFNCKTTLVEEFRQQFGESLEYSKNRAVLIGPEINQTSDALKMCIASALTYHLRGSTKLIP